MSRSWFRPFLPLLLLTACPGPQAVPQTNDEPEPSPALESLTERCDSAIRHVAIGIYPESGRPKGGELAVIEQLVTLATDVCKKEGLSEAHAACFRQAELGDGLAAVRECLGDKSTWPSWFTGAGVQL